MLPKKDTRKDAANARSRKIEREAECARLLVECLPFFVHVSPLEVEGWFHGGPVASVAVKHARGPLPLDPVRVHILPINDGNRNLVQAGGVGSEHQRNENKHKIKGTTPVIEAIFAGIYLGKLWKLLPSSPPNHRRVL